MLKVRITRTAPRATALAMPIADGALVPNGLRAAANAAEFSGRAGESCEIYAEGAHVLLAGLGDQSQRAGRAAGAMAAAKLSGTRRVALDARGLSPGLAVALAEGACLRAWRPDIRRGIPDPDAPLLAAIDLLVDDPDAVRPVWTRTEAGLRGSDFARDLVAEPANRLTPARFAERLEGLAEHGIEVEVLKRHRLRELGFGALLAVGAGSPNKPRLVVLRWPGLLPQAPVAFVGKGITFDTGGICIKPAEGMWDMRADMAGAAACAGAMLALARRRSPAPTIAVLALAENMTGGESYRPGDVLTSYSGRTIEVIDTDAEGRLVLADALAYAAAQYRPRAMIDLATLTGSIVTALGHHMAGLFDNDAGLAARIAAAGAAVEERVWRMPIGAQHRQDIASDIADLRNCQTGRFLPDACHAAAFLREFVDGIPWAHLDIAGVEQHDEADDLHARGPTGFGVRLLDMLMERWFEEEE